MKSRADGSLSLGDGDILDTGEREKTFCKRSLRCAPGSATALFSPKLVLFHCNGICFNFSFGLSIECREDDAAVVGSLSRGGGGELEKSNSS